MARQRKAPSTSASSDPSRVVQPPTVPVTASTSSSTSAASATSASADVRIKQRVPPSSRSGKEMPSAEDLPMSEYPPVDGGGSDDAVPTKSHPGARNKWIVLAIASGACAAFNGVFAKLWVFLLCLYQQMRSYTKRSYRATGELTASISKGVAHFLHLSAAETVVNVVVRCVSYNPTRAL